MNVYNSNYLGTEHDTYVTKMDLVDLIYPIGSIYMSLNSTSPAILFGGTWEQITEGTFMMAAGNTYTGSSTGGKRSYVAADMPSHSHTRGTMNITGQWKIKGDANNAGVDAPATASGAFSSINETASGSSVAGSNWSCGTGFNFNASSAWTGSTSISGTNTTAEIVPPYLAVYIWKRTA